MTKLQTKNYSPDVILVILINNIQYSPSTFYHEAQTNISRQSSPAHQQVHFLGGAWDGLSRIKILKRPRSLRSKRKGTKIKHIEEVARRLPSKDRFYPSPSSNSSQTHILTRSRMKATFYKFLIRSESPPPFPKAKGSTIVLWVP